MKNRNQIFKFKKSPKQKICSTIKNNTNYNDYSKIICEIFDKKKEESKINNINYSKLINGISNNIRNTQITNKHSKNIMKTEFKSKKRSKNNIKDDTLSISIKDKKFYHNMLNSVNSKKYKNIIHSSSEKNMKKEMFLEDNIKKNNNAYANTKINNFKSNVISLNKNIKININLNSKNNNFLFRKQKFYNIKREENNSNEKKTNMEKIKNVEELKEKTINIQYNINQIFEHKKGNDQINQFYQSNINTKTNEIKKKNINSINLTKIINKNTIKSKKINLNITNNSPDKIIIKINNVGKNFQKKININNSGMNLNNRDSKKVKLLKNKNKCKIHNNTDNTPTSQNRKSTKINSKKKCIIDIKDSNNNLSKNSSNLKISYSNNQISTKKSVKVKSINIDLNFVNQNFNKLSDSVEKTDKNNDNSLSEKNNLTIRESEIPQFSTKINYIHREMELSLNGLKEDTELNHSFKTSLSLTKKSRSLNKKRDEKKKKRFKLSNINDEEENERKLNDILLNLSKQKDVGYSFINAGQRSEPKKLIDKIRKSKKLQKA